ncbi:uncharacterized protein N7515_009787 [Penicillium bovifimosum]|uniref:Uncharacterized protein n=1 Tax=Penicillium bovifimosum TaxID=126998 RepID=A0A9W9KUP1_9EURO|nr:uncharacterized protein N7515_009787 [Penicillium bovifimosum]KAJ5120399.1 hypothetical protein N7515_009787 [Penicillium bovifimosum]
MYAAIRSKDLSGPNSDAVGLASTKVGLGAKSPELMPTQPDVTVAIYGAKERGHQASKRWLLWISQLGEACGLCGCQSSTAFSSRPRTLMRLLFFAPFIP